MTTTSIVYRDQFLFPTLTYKFKLFQLLPSKPPNLPPPLLFVEIDSNVNDLRRMEEISNPQESSLPLVTLRWYVVAFTF